MGRNTDMTAADAATIMDMLNLDPWPKCKKCKADACVVKFASKGVTCRCPKPKCLGTWTVPIEGWDALAVALRVAGDEPFKLGNAAVMRARDGKAVRLRRLRQT